MIKKVNQSPRVYTDFMNERIEFNRQNDKNFIFPFERAGKGGFHKNKKHNNRPFLAGSIGGTGGIRKRIDRNRLAWFLPFESHSKDR